MSEIIKFIIENIRSLTSFDYLLIFTFVLLLTLACFFVLRWLFQERFKSQSDVISLKEQAISSYQRNVELLNQENTKLASHILQLRKTEFEKEKLEKDVDKIKQFLIKYYYLYTYSLQLFNITLIQLNVENMLFIYLGVRADKFVAGAPSVINLYNKLHLAEKELTKVSSALFDSWPNSNDKLLEVLTLSPIITEFNSSKVLEPINQVNDTITQVMNKFFKMNILEMDGQVSSDFHSSSKKPLS